MAELINAKRLNQIIAGQAKPAVHEHALEIGARAEGILSAHHKTGEHQITVTDGKTDAKVNLEGPAALSVEVGHFAGYKGERKYVEGIHALRDAAGL